MIQEDMGQIAEMSHVRHVGACILRRRPISGVAVCLLLTLDAGIQAQPDVVLPEDRIAALQLFLTDRPNVERISFVQRKLLGRQFLNRFVPEAQVPADWETNSTLTVMSGAWQPDQYYISFANSKPKNALVASDLAYGYDRGRFWQISGGVVTICAPGDQSYAPTLDASTGGFKDVLNLGIPDIEDSSVRWEGQRFSAKLRSRESKMQGELFAAGNEPAYIECGVPGKQWSYKITYEYRDNAGNLPGRYQIAVKEGSGKSFSPVIEISILELQLTRVALQSEKVAVYEQERFKKIPTWVVITNGQRIVQTPSGKIIKAEPARLASNRTTIRWLVGSLLLVSTLTVILLLRSRSKKQKTQ